jgi:hypothetical protein
MFIQGLTREPAVLGFDFFEDSAGQPFATTEELQSAASFLLVVRNETRQTAASERAAYHAQNLHKASSLKDHAVQAPVVRTPEVGNHMRSSNYTQ